MPARPPLVLITRPEAAARRLGETLEARGYAALAQALLTIEPLGRMAPAGDDVQAIALTSAHAVPALDDRAKRLPVFTVGRATAAAARDAGCSRVIAGDGDAAALALLIGERCRPEDGQILHLSGEVVREDLAQGLEERGFALRRDVVYRALPCPRLDDDVQAAWEARAIAAVLLFSPRTADILVHLLLDHGLASQVDSATAICLSEVTATPCRVLTWKDICVAAHPNQDALIRALEGSIKIC
ncbi:MAG: uroporphyrinogen-III synthase [Alphaproteobacteria bacterium]